MKKQKKQKDQRQIHSQKLSNCDKNHQETVENQEQTMEHGVDYYEAVEDNQIEE